MSENFLIKLLEHNNWANLQILQVCSTLSDEQLDAQPRSVTKGNIRSTLIHLVASQRGYLSLLTQASDAEPQTSLEFAELQASVMASGEGLLALARDETNMPLMTKIPAKNGFVIVPWLVMLQVINYATEHREQIKSMLSDLGVTPPTIDGWMYGEVTKAYT